MAYPRQLKLSEKVKTSLKSYLNDELTRHLAERTEYIQEIKNWQRDYWVPESKEQAKIPFVGASRIIIPLTAIAVDAIHSRVMSALFHTEPFAMAKFNSLTSEHETAFNRWINHELKHGSPKAHKSLENPILDIEKYGTGVTKPAYCKIEKKAVRPNALDPSKEDEIIVTTKRGAEFQHVPLANYLCPNSAVDNQHSEWDGEIHLETPFQMVRLEKSGFFIPGTMEELKSYYFKTSVDNDTQVVRDAQENMENSKPSWPKQIEWAEFSLGYDIDEDGEVEEIVVHYHHGAGLLMSVVYNWTIDLRRPYIIGNFIKVEGRRKGIGICKRSSQFQKIITTIHRQRLDAGTIANMKMFKVHRLSNYGPDEPIFPGKMWILDDMTHIETLQTSEVFTSAFANEQAALLYEQQMLGVNELTSGMPSQGTPGTATDTTLRLQEGSKKLNYEMYNIRDFVSQNYVAGLLLTKQYGSRTLDMYMQAHPEEGALIQEVLSYPAEMMNDSILFDLHAIGIDSNKTVERTNWMQIAQASQQFMTGIMQLLSAGHPELVPAFTEEAIIQASAVYKQFLETYDVRDEDKLSMNKFIQDLINTMKMQQQQNAQLQQGVPSNGNGSVLPSQSGNGAGRNGQADLASFLRQPGIQANS